MHKMCRIARIACHNQKGWYFWGKWRLEGVSRIKKPEGYSHKNIGYEGDRRGERKGWGQNSGRRSMPRCMKRRSSVFALKEKMKRVSE